MRETRKQRKQRLQAAGLWKDYVTLRANLKAQGTPARAARAEALKQVESRPAPAASPTPRGEQPVRRGPTNDFDLGPDGYLQYLPDLDRKKHWFAERYGLRLPEDWYDKSEEWIAQQARLRWG